MAEQESKRCSKCRETKPLAHFYAQKASPDGLKVWCSDCCKANASQWHSQNREIANAYHRARHHNNREHFNEISRRYHAANRDRQNARNAQRQKEKWPEVRKQQSNWRKLNPANTRASKKKWRQQNPEKGQEHTRTRRARQLSAPGRGVTGEQWQLILAESLGLCAYCNERKLLTMDHIEPLNLGGAHDPDNVAAACKPCNSSKNDAPLLLWLARRALERAA